MKIRVEEFNCTRCDRHILYAGDPLDVLCECGEFSGASKRQSKVWTADLINRTRDDEPATEPSASNEDN